MRTLHEPIAVTGVGAVCNLGDDLPTILHALRAGLGGPFTQQPEAVAGRARCTLAGRYTGDLSDEALGVDRQQSHFMGRGSRLALRAARQAVAMSGVTPSELAVVVGSGAGDVDTHIDVQERLARSPMHRVGPTLIPRLMSSTVSANLVAVLGAQGASVTAAAACAGGAWNIAIAAALLDSGHADAALAGGVEVWDTHFHAGFDSMRAYNGVDNERPERASRPYAADREGFIMGEGAGLLVLEPLSRAVARGATVLGLLRGWGMSSDGTGNMVAPTPDGPRRAMRQALAHAGLNPADVGYVNTHGTSTPMGDVAEIVALREVFGATRPAYSSTKGATGHTISAAGALEAIFTLAMVREGWLAPSVHAEPLDPALLDYPPVTAPTDTAVAVAMSNSFGFGGTNVSLVLSR